MMLVMSDAETEGTRVSGTVKWFDPGEGVRIRGCCRAAARIFYCMRMC